jgi:hypothetical protein
VKGNNTLGWILIFAGMIVIYAGYKNVPILSVLGIGQAASNAGGTSLPTPIPTPNHNTRVTAG